MVDFAYVCGMASDEAPGETGHDYDHEVHSPEGFCGTGFFDVRQGSERRLNTNRKNSQTCKYCGAKELFWFQPNIGRYRLKNKDGSEHVCQEYFVKNTPLSEHTTSGLGMNYEGIKTHSERCESHPNHQWGTVTHQMIISMLHDEIDQLRDYIEAQINKYHVYPTRSKLKPLTDKDIDKLMVRTLGFSPKSLPEFARAIERAHRIGGEK